MEHNNHITVLVALHKQCDLPKDSVYLPVQCGAALHPAIAGMQADNAGEGISEKNPTFCELTAIYWAWKNLDSDFIGLCHYRRFFAGKPWNHPKPRRIASREVYAAALGRAPVLLPKKRNYFVETNYSQYIHAHHKQDLDATRQILQELCPDYVAAFDHVMGKTTGHRFNMFVMRRDYFHRYCSWLFPILFRLEAELDTSGYSAYDSRVFGFVAERLLDVWVAQEQIPYTQLPVVFTEKQHWGRKIAAFLLRKIHPVNPAP